MVDAQHLNCERKPPCLAKMAILAEILAFFLLHESWDLARHLQSPKPRNPEKSQKVSRKEFGTPRPRTPEKFRKKSEKSEK